MRPIRDRRMNSKLRNQPRPRPLVTNRLKDRVVWKERIPRKIHLRHESLRERPANQREMNMRRTPRVVMIPPRIRPRLNSHEPIAPLRIRHTPPRTTEIRVKRRRPSIPPMPITSRRVRLPDLNQRVTQRLTFGIAHHPEHDYPLANRLSRMLHGQIVIMLTQHQHRTKLRPCDLGRRLRQIHQRLLRMT